VRLTREKDGLCDPCRTAEHRRYGANRREGRGSDDSYYHTVAWQQIRDEHLKLQPLCQACLRSDIKRKATDVHHVVERRDG
jgi:hypothetical protein